MLELLVGHIGVLAYLALSTNFAFFNLEISQSPDNIFIYDISHTLEVEMAFFWCHSLFLSTLDIKQVKV